MMKLIEDHGWKLVVLVSVVIFSCSIAFAAWMLAPPRYRVEKLTSRGGFEYLYRVDTRTGYMKQVVVHPNDRPPLAKNETQARPE